MGHGFEYRCTKCGREDSILLGTGMYLTAESEWFRELCLEGKHGMKMKQFVEQYPDLVVDSRMVMYRCSCGGWKGMTETEVAGLCGYHMRKAGSLWEWSFTGGNEIASGYENPIIIHKDCCEWLSKFPLKIEVIE